MGGLVKPRIWKRGRWICTAENERGVMVWAEADTPAGAYHNWRAGNAVKYAVRTPWEQHIG